MVRTRKKQNGDAGSLNGEHTTNVLHKKHKYMANNKNLEQSGKDEAFSKLSLETFCKIFKYLPIQDIMKLEHLSQKLHQAVDLHLRLVTKLDFMEEKFEGDMSVKMTDSKLYNLLERCPVLTRIYGFHPTGIVRRRQRSDNTLSIAGILDAFSMATNKNLVGVEISDVILLEALTSTCPQIKIIGPFRNRNGTFPISLKEKVNLKPNLLVLDLNLTGVVVMSLPQLDTVQHLTLCWVNFQMKTPFRSFSCRNLSTFVMKHCSGPLSSLAYVPLITALAGSTRLNRLELVRVPFLGGLMELAIHDSWRSSGFRQLKRITFSLCRHAIDTDLGFLMIASANHIEEVAIQPSLTRDRFFTSMKLAVVNFTFLKVLHLGHVDDWPPPGQWKNEDLALHGLADSLGNPAVITDIGLESAGRVFLHLRKLTLFDCPHVQDARKWFNQRGNWVYLKTLYIRKCHSVKLDLFCAAIQNLSSLEDLDLENIFREPPKGCSRVGLTAGTVLGIARGSGNIGDSIIAPVGPPANDRVDEIAGANQDRSNTAQAVDEQGGSQSDGQQSDDPVPDQRVTRSQTSDEDGRVGQKDRVSAGKSKHGKKKKVPTATLR